MNGVCCSSISWSNDSSIPCTIKQCLKGYYNDSGICREICGDGILFDLECDDGNLVDGDGCSSTCQIETNYTCVNGSSTTPSLCSYNKPLDLTLTSSTKDIKSNTVVFEIVVGPALKVLDTFNFSTIMTSNIPNAQISFVYSNGQLKVTVQYNESIQSKNVSIELSPPTIYNNTFDMKVSSSKFTISPSNAEAYYYPDSVYTENTATDYVLLVSTIAGLVLCGAILRKLIGLELMAMLQMSFFTLSLCNTLHPIFTLWGQRGYITNGFNELPDNIDNLFTPYTMPQNIQNILYKPQYLQNFNWMFVAELSIFLLGLLFTIVGKYTNRILFKIGAFTLKDILVTLVFFNTINSSFSFGLQIITMTQTTFGSGELACDFIAILISLIFNGIVLYVYFKYTEIFEHQLILLKFNKASTIHPFVFCIYRFLIGFLMGVFNTYKFCIFLVFCLELGYLIYTIVNKPFKYNYQLVRGIINGSATCYHILTLILYEYVLTSQYTSSHPASTALAWIDVVLIISATCFSIYSWIYSVCKEGKDVSSKIANESDTVEDMRVKDMIHTMQDLKGEENQNEAESQVKKTKDQTRFDTTESKRKIMDPDEESQSNGSEI